MTAAAASDRAVAVLAAMASRARHTASGVASAPTNTTGAVAANAQAARRPVILDDVARVTDHASATMATPMLTQLSRRARCRSPTASSAAAATG